MCNHLGLFQGLVHSPPYSQGAVRAENIAKIIMTPEQISEWDEDKESDESFRERHGMTASNAIERESMAVIPSYLSRDGNTHKFYKV